MTGMPTWRARRRMCSFLVSRSHRLPVFFSQVAQTAEGAGELVLLAGETARVSFVVCPAAVPSCRRNSSSLITLPPLVTVWKLVNMAPTEPAVVDVGMPRRPPDRANRVPGPASWCLRRAPTTAGHGWFLDDLVGLSSVVDALPEIDDVDPCAREHEAFSGVFQRRVWCPKWTPLSSN